MKSITLVVLSLVLLLSGCAFEQLSPNYYFGDAPKNYRDSIPLQMNPTLKDPESAKYRFGKPQKGYLNNGLLHGGKIAWEGWFVPFQVNAKNSFGGYTGWDDYLAFITYGSVRLIEPGSIEHNLLNLTVVP